MLISVRRSLNYWPGAKVFDAREKSVRLTQFPPSGFISRRYGLLVKFVYCAIRVCALNVVVSGSD